MTCVLRDLMALHVIQHVMRASGDQTVMERVEHVKMKQHVTEKVANVQLRVSALLLKHYLTKSDNLGPACKLGYLPPLCVEECPSGSFGVDCASTCHWKSSLENKRF